MILQMPLSDGKVAVYFRLPATIWGDRVALVGDFNGWSPSATPMRPGEQYWEARMILPAGGCYAYAYLIDDADWCTEGPTRATKQRDSASPVTLQPLDLPQVRSRIADLTALEYGAREPQGG